MEFVLRTVATAGGVWAATWLVPGIHLYAATTGEKVFSLAVVAIVIGVVNALIKPFAQALGLCLVVLTFGLFLVVINALLLEFAAWVSGLVGIGFYVDGFWPAVWGSIIVSIVSGVLNAIFNTDKYSTRAG
ncbi:phage holin family protein [Tessaracoccus caeni]|uniref:phage holin family protein n=1 Tax=Tessaracoccus caeni TaxID=3031239 RepID=UPI0023DB0F74|nr:phage holin family protein [Tessaracoccus caeni]MDF1486929.1 phage holin family protein [Tessaracoccus caeni]